MAEIRELKSRNAQTNEQTIALLRAYLECAEGGEILAVAIAAVEPSGASRTQSSGSEHFQGLLGAVAILQHRMLHTVQTDV